MKLHWRQRLLIISLLLWSATGSAQQLEEVIVTARKQTESLQETPLSITAFSASQLREQGIKNIKELETQVPGLNLGGGGNGISRNSAPYIRGVGQRQIKQTLDPSVAFYIDGVYQGRGEGIPLDVLDIESVQVVRGPQGTLFGKNVTGGAILVETRRPDEGLSGRVQATGGNFDQQSFTATVNVPILADRLYSRFTLGTVRSDGWAINQVNGDTYNDDDRQTAIGSLRWLAGPATTVDYAFFYSRSRQAPRAQQCAYLQDDLGWDKSPTLSLIETLVGFDFEAICDAQGPENGLPPDRFFTEQNTTRDTPVGNRGSISLGIDVGHYNDYVSRQHMLNIEHDLGPLWGLDSARFKSITGWLSTDKAIAQDLDATGVNLLALYDRSDQVTDQYSQEFQLLGSALDERLRFATGLYLFREETRPGFTAGYNVGPFFQPAASSQPVNLGGGLILPGGVDRLIVLPVGFDGATKNEAQAVFVQASYDLTAYTEITAGVRSTWETRLTRNRNYSIVPASLHANNVAPDFVAGGTIFVWSTNALIPAEFSQWRFTRDTVLEDDFSDRGITPMASFKVHASDALADRLKLDSAMSFVTWSTGFRSGGVDAGRNPGELGSFDAEEVQNIEVGLKLEAFDRRLRVNTAAFYTELTDQQLTNVAVTGNVPRPYIENIGRSTIDGGELEIQALPTPKLAINASIAYTHDNIREYSATAFVNNQEMIVDRSDERLPNIPRWQVTLNLNYNIPTRDLGTFSVNGNTSYRSEVYVHFDRASWLSGFYVGEETVFANLRLGWQSPAGRYAVSIWGKNLTDNDDYLVGGIPIVEALGFGGAAYADPRTYGIDFTVAFGDER